MDVEAVVDVDEVVVAVVVEVIEIIKVIITYRSQIVTTVPPSGTPCPLNNENKFVPVATNGTAAVASLPSTRTPTNAKTMIKPRHLPPTTPTIPQAAPAPTPLVPKLPNGLDFLRLCGLTKLKQ